MCVVCVAGCEMCVCVCVAGCEMCVCVCVLQAVRLCCRL